MPLTYQFRTPEAVSEVCFFLGNKSPEQDGLNGSILNVASVINNEVASAAESEVGACFHNTQSGAPLRVILTELGHKQPPTPLRTDSSTEFSILNESIRQNKSKEIYMRYHWLTEIVCQKHLDIYWRPGLENLCDFHTKHHSAQYYKDVHGLILHQENSLQDLRGRVGLLSLPQPPCAPARTHGQIQAPREPLN
jgi:hypothetical protein